MKLYELTQDLREVEARLMEATEASLSGDEVAADMAQVYKDTLEGIQGTIEQKLLGIAKLAREKRAEAEAIKAEKQRIEKRQRAAENVEARLREYMAWAMEQTNLSKTRDELVSISLGQGRPKVKIASPEALKDYPEVWRPYKYDETNIDKTLLKQMVEEGTELPGVELITERVLTIR